MEGGPLLAPVIIAAFAVLAILMVGIVGFARGGDFNRKYANKIMRLRILAQAVAVVMILVFIFLKGN